MPRTIGAALLLIASCGSDPRPDPPPQPSDPVCASIAGHTFRSLMQLPGGLGPDGPVLDHHYVSFSVDGSEFRWTVEDMVISGWCSCRDGVLTVRESPLEKSTLAASFDIERKVLTWNGIEFRSMP